MLLFIGFDSVNNGYKQTQSPQAIDVIQSNDQLILENHTERFNSESKTIKTEPHIFSLAYFCYLWNMPYWRHQTNHLCPSMMIHLLNSFEQFTANDLFSKVTESNGSKMEFDRWK